MTGKLHPDSDLDIAALCQRKTRLNLLSLITSLNRIFKTNRVDLTNLTQADPLLIYQVTQHSQLLSGDDHLYTQLQLKALHVYQDYLPYLRLEQQLVEARTKSYVTA